MAATFDPPPQYQRTMVDLHRLAIAAIAPARYQATERFGLRWARGGFMTPPFGEGQRVGVIGDRLVVDAAGAIEEFAITTIDDAAAAIGAGVDTKTAAEHDSPEITSTSSPLFVEAAHTSYIARWWGIGTEALEALRGDPDTVNPGEVQLWPGHFDVGVEFGSEDARASFGASPGDEGHDEPYLYISAWWPDKLDLGDPDFWNASGFTGAVLTASKLSTTDPVAQAVEFYTKGRDLLAAATG